jgi:hypothetical protein
VEDSGQKHHSQCVEPWDGSNPSGSPARLVNTRPLQVFGTHPIMKSERSALRQRLRESGKGDLRSIRVRGRETEPFPPQMG